MATVTVRPGRIYEARLRAGLSQSGLAHAIRSLGDFRTSERSVRNWEKGKHTPHADIVPAIADATGVEISFLYEDDQPDDDGESRSMRIARIRHALSLSGRHDLVADLEALAGISGALVEPATGAGAGSPNATVEFAG